MSERVSPITDLITNVFALGNRLEQQGVWIKRAYADKLLEVFVIIGGEVKVGEILALTDKSEEGIEWMAEFPRALSACVKAFQNRK